MGNKMRITTRDEIDSQRAHGIACLILLVLLCVVAMRIYYLQKDVIDLYRYSQSLDNENAVQGEAIHRIIERMNKND